MSAEKGLGQLQGVHAPCLRCNNEVDGFLVPDGKLICPNCDPPQVYEHWKSLWEQFHPKQQSDLRENRRERRYWPIIHPLSAVAILAAGSLLFGVGYCPNGYGRFFCMLSVAPSLAMSLTARKLMLRSKGNERAHLRLSDFLCLPIYLLPTLILAIMLQAKSDAARQEDLLVDFLLLLYSVAYELSFAGFVWAYASPSDADGWDNLCFLTIGAYLGAFIGWMVFPMSIVAGWGIP